MKKVKKFSHYLLVAVSVSTLLATGCSEDKPAKIEHAPSAPAPAPVAAEPKAEAPAHVAPGVASAPSAAVTHGAHWAYSGKEGPDNWGHLAAEYAACATGTQQSPIDITGVTVRDMPPLTTHYQDVPLQIANNGHTLQVQYPAGSTLTIDGQSYELIQFHFHSPAEHTLGGKSAELVAHLVHKNAEGKLAVIESRYSVGDEHPLIKTLWEHAPKDVKQIDVPETKINAAALLPTNTERYFNYEGSLTTPPCTEGVNWLVLAEETRVSPDQVAGFTALFPMSARPVQAIMGRPVIAAH